MRQHRKAALFLAAAMSGLLLLAGCSSQSGGGSQSAGDQLAQIQERGEIVIALEGT